MKGNENTMEAVRLELDPPLIASKIRIVPYSSRVRTACLRLELYGCNDTGLQIIFLAKIVFKNIVIWPTAHFFRRTNGLFPLQKWLSGWRPRF